jgi:polyhydroxybutyrate depolymerase
VEQHHGHDGETADTVERRPTRRGAKVLGERTRRGHRRHVPAFLAILTLLGAIVVTAPPASSAAAPRCGNGELVRRTVVSGRLRRSYLVRSAGPRARVLLAFHGYTGSAEILAATSGLDHAAFDAGYTVVLPDGSGSPSRWAIPGHLSGPDDVIFVDAVLRDLRRNSCGQTRRVVAVGYSNGAAFTGLLACRRPRLLSAMAFVGGANLASPCASTRTRASVPVVIVHGDADEIVPIGGGPVIGGALQAEPLDRTIARWRAARGRRVEVVIVPGQSHAWPSVATEQIVTTFAV